MLIKTYDSRSARVDRNNSRTVNSGSRHSASVAACRHGGNSAGCRLSNGDGAGGTVVLKTKSSVKGFSDDEIEGAEVGAGLRILIESSSDTGSFGGADVSTVAKAGREGSSLTLHGGFDDQNITSDTLTALDNEVNIESCLDDLSVVLRADQIFKRSSGSACRRASAGGSGVGASSAGGGAVANARLDSSESNARSSFAAV